jgi:flagellar protein FlbD
MRAEGVRAFMRRRSSICIHAQETVCHNLQAHPAIERRRQGRGVHLGWAETCDYTTAGCVKGCAVIWLTRFDGTRFALNADMIQSMEETPDTVITLANGHHFVVRERTEEIVRQLVEFRHRVQVGFGDGR